jgi:hypothetical protein
MKRSRISDGLAIEVVNPKFAVVTDAFSERALQLRIERPWHA